MCLLIGMDTGLLILIIIGIVGIVVAVGDILFRVVIEPKLKKSRERKELHRKSIVFDSLKKEFQNMNITYDEQEFNVLITGLKELEEKRMYRYTLQHLDAYKPIIGSWNKSSDMIKEINKDLGILEEHAFEKIKYSIGKKYIKLLSYSIKFIIRETIIKDIRNSTIIIRDVGKYIEISKDGTQWYGIHYRAFGKMKIKNFLKDLENDTKFQRDLISIQENYKDIKKEFYDAFKIELKKLLDNIDGREEDLKGKCRECSFWVRVLGDC